MKRDVNAEQGRRMGKANKTHGMCHTPTYRTWKGVLQRCGNPNHVHYEKYGGRGIKVCDRWCSFAKFFEDMGSRPLGKTLDRKNVNRGYSKRNCRWATLEEQANNRRPSSEWKFEDEEEFF
jgi:hypothetical protein